MYVTRWSSTITPPHIHTPLSISSILSVSRLIYECNMTHCWVRREFRSVTWLIYDCDPSLNMGVTSLIDEYDMNLVTWHDSFMSVTQVSIWVWHDLFMSVTHWSVWHDSFMSQKWLIEAASATPYFSLSLSLSLSRTHTHTAPGTTPPHRACSCPWERLLSPKIVPSLHKQRKNWETYRHSEWETMHWRMRHVTHVNAWRDIQIDGPMSSWATWHSCAQQ